VIELEVADLVLIASRTLGLDTGQVLDLLDPAAAEYALAQARPGSGPRYRATCAAALLHALVRQRPLRRGSQQVALAAMLQFLALNGQDMDPDPAEDVAAMVTRVEAGTLDIKDVADWLAPRLRPSGRAAAQVKEAPMREHQALPLAERIKRATIRTRPKPVSKRFTDRARQVVVLAQDEARELALGGATLAHVLSDQGAGYDLVRERVVALVTSPREQADPKTRLVRLLVPAALADVTGQLRQVQRQKAAALEAGDLDSAAALRGQERHLRAEKLRLEHEWAADVDVQAVIAENQRVHRELDRLRDLLRQHGIEADGGTARTA
jgi:hypothetical protein